MSDIVERLKTQPPIYGGDTQELRDAAAREIERLRLALKKIASGYEDDSLIRQLRDVESYGPDMIRNVGQLCGRAADELERLQRKDSVEHSAVREHETLMPTE